MANKPALTQDYPDDPSSRDFTLNGKGAWVRVADPNGDESIAIFIMRTENGVVVELCRDGAEMDWILARAEAGFGQQGGSE